MEDTSVFTAVALPIALAVIMVSLGLELTLADFKRIFVYPKGVAIGLLNLCLIAPALAFGIAELFDLDPVLAIGLVLLGASPGGTLANLLTHLAKGDTALSVTMTALSSVGALLIVPIYLSLAAEHFSGSDIGDVSMAGVVVRVFFITLVPLSIDMVLDNFADVALATLALNVAAMSVSFAIAKAAQLSDRQATAIAMELGIHNSTLAIAVAGTIDIDLAIPAAVYSGFMFVTAGLFARYMASRNGGAGDASPRTA
jgi:bile acid:Na+ symporter, BASS family